MVSFKKTDDIFENYFLFNEKLQSFHWFGGLFVLTGIILANKNLFKIK